MAKKDTYRRMLVAAGLVVAALAYGCAGGRGTIGDAVDHGGPLVSEEGLIAFTRATSFDPDFEGTSTQLSWTAPGGGG